MRKLYVLVCKELTPSQKAVQAGHAVAEFTIRNPSEWRNEILVYLDAPDIDYCLYLTEGGPLATFYEPDLNNRLTAIATTQHHRYFDRLRLL